MQWGRLGMQPGDTDVDRALSARAMIERVRPHMGGMGITRLADLTGLDRIGVPVFAAVRPNSRSVATSQGKGLSRDAARVGALMEAVESWHAERPPGPVRYASARDLAGLPLVDTAEPSSLTSSGLMVMRAPCTCSRLSQTSPGGALVDDAASSVARFSRAAMMRLRSSGTGVFGFGSVPSTSR